jgi:hypothetical protein
MPDSDITLGEVARRLTSFETRTTAQFAELRQRQDSQQFVHRETYDVMVTNLTRRVEDLEESKKWLARTLVLAFVVSFLAPILVALVVAP